MSLPPDLAAMKKKIEQWAKEYGLDFFDVIFEVLDWNQMNMVASYGGFPNRYPHWRFGMEYERMSKSYAYGLSKIYEMVINNDPCYAYLLYSNKMVDQKMVMAHVYAHCDFFKNNVYFSNTNRKMMDEMANHRTRVLKYIDRFGVDEVESFTDSCLSLENLLDYQKLLIPRNPSRVQNQQGEEVSRIKSKPYMEKFVNPPEFLASERLRMDEEKIRQARFPPKPEKDVIGFLMEHAPLQDWEHDILGVIREEAYYYAPQGQTKILNEGWACVAPETFIYTDRGLITIKELVDGSLPARVHDGETLQPVTDYARFKNRKTVRIKTRRGYELEGSTTHQLLLNDQKTWKRLDEVKLGDTVVLGKAADLWGENEIKIEWTIPQRLTLEKVAAQANVNLSTVVRHHTGVMNSRFATVLNPLLAVYKEELGSLSYMQNKRQDLRIPAVVDESFAGFLGYLIGDGNISRVKRDVGFTTGDAEQATQFAFLVRQLFDLTPKIKKDGNRYRVLTSSLNLIDFLEALGLESGPCARRKTVPQCIMRSPKKVVAAFLRSLFDCDGYAGPCGVILSTSSLEMSKRVQILLLNFGILSTCRLQNHDIWNVEIFGQSAKKYLEEIGFGLQRKQKRLQDYISNHRWFKEQRWEDEIVSMEEGTADVYDITVANTHRYAAHGFINHNSFWHSKIMTEKALGPDEFIDYADHHSGTVAMQPGQLNPYKIGLELLRDIEERWNKGRFGKEYNECNNMLEKKNWDKKLGLGRQKVFEVRKLYNDVMFIDEFLTPEFCVKNKFFVFAFNVSADRYEIATREFEKIKRQLLFQLTNFGNPIIHLIDANYKNRGELYLKHSHEESDIKIDWAKETQKALFKIWKRTIHLETVLDGVPKILTFDGKEHHEARP